MMETMDPKLEVHNNVIDYLKGQFDMDDKNLEEQAVEKLTKGRTTTLASMLAECEQLTTVDRNAEYGDFHDNLKLEAALMRLLMDAGLDKYSDTHNACIHHVIHKLARIASGKLKKDNYVDGTNYLNQAYISETRETGNV